MEKIEEFLAEREANNLLRVLEPLSFRGGGKIIHKGKEYIDFSSNDYLGFSGHSLLKEASKQAIQEWGLSACASRLLSGNLEIHHQLEEKVAIFKGKPQALVFNSGYQANLGIISSLYKRGDVIFSDRLNHASIIDGIILSKAKLLRFRHNDLNHLEFLLKKERTKFKQGLIITESVFSMEGDKALLGEIIEFKKRYNCQVYVDEAHAAGVFGSQGRGLAQPEEVDLIMGTFSKALGSFGAYLACAKSIKDYLINSCRSFIYSTALPPAVIAANIAGLDSVDKEPHRRKILLENADYLRNELLKKGFKARGSSQIIPLIIGESKRCVEISEELKARGYWVFPIRPPTVPHDESRLRFSLTYYHNREILGKLINDICQIFPV